LLRTTDNHVGFGWVEPTARRPTVEAAIVLVLKWNDYLYETRSDFNRIGLSSRHHTTSLFSYDWQMDVASGTLTFALAERDALVGELTLRNDGRLPQKIEATVLAQVRSGENRLSIEHGRGAWTIRDSTTGQSWIFDTTAADARAISPDLVFATAPSLTSAPGTSAGFTFDLVLTSGTAESVGLGLARSADGRSARPGVAPGASETCADRRRQDATFYDTVALPVGDWPDTWKRGWIYDLETTRACIFPPGGVFHNEWPSWMMSWPRVVIAEGTLDATRFSYADPHRALDLAQTIFVDAPAANVPCVFQGGEPNMVAKDGTVCGTSPAWCLPFHNLWLLYCRTLDRDWATTLVPRLEAYLDYWLRERVDEQGWVVYKCTWEAGEDCTPRLDPKAEGDEVISQWVRPVELQATMAYSASILGRLCREAGLSDRAPRWEDVARDYTKRTRQLWDAATGRYRDWDKRTGTFLESRGEPSYWKTDPVRFSALSLAPIVAGLADGNQLARLRAEIENYDAAPWCLWPSWSFVVAEAASAAGWHDFAGRFARRIVDRVYVANDRRSLADASRPTPGTSPEFWPLDLADFNGSDGYGWGATTTSLWIRQVFGFLDDEPSEDLSFVLAPSLPSSFLAQGRRFGFTNVPYRGWRLTIVYEAGDQDLIASITADRTMSPKVRGPKGEAVPVEHISSANEARFKVEPNRRYRVTLGRL
jgi:hypothetical protein